MSAVGTVSASVPRVLADALTMIAQGYRLLVDAGATPLGAVPSAALVDLAGQLEVARRQADAVDARVVAEVAARGTAGEYAACSTSDLLVQRLHIDPGEARARVERASELAPRESVTGEVLEPLYPKAAAALAAGEISSRHVREIVECVERLPSNMQTQHADEVEQVLVDAGRHAAPRVLRHLVARIDARLNPEGMMLTESDQQRLRGVDLNRRRDGSFALQGRLTAEAGLVWQPILDALSAPQHCVEPGAASDTDAGSADGEVCSQPLQSDERSASQRRHDGFLEAGLRLLRSATLPEHGGVPVSVLVTTTAGEVTADASQSGAGLGVTGHGDVLPLTLALRLGGADTELTTVTLDTAGAVMSFGRCKRVASREQRRALAARDGGCSFPGCTRPPAWTEAHHVSDYAAGGETSIHNLCLLCRYHHRMFAGAGWRVSMARGVPEWIPPPWLDPAQRPRRNIAHERLDPLVDLRPT